MDESRIETEMGRRRKLHDRNVAGVVELLERRSELRGVYPMADHVAENLTWMV